MGWGCNWRRKLALFDIDGNCEHYQDGITKTVRDDYEVSSIIGRMGVIEKVCSTRENSVFLVSNTEENKQRILINGGFSDHLTGGVSSLETLPKNLMTREMGEIADVKCGTASILILTNGNELYALGNNTLHQYGNQSDLFDTPTFVYNDVVAFDTVQIHPRIASLGGSTVWWSVLATKNGLVLTSGSHFMFQQGRYGMYNTYDDIYTPVDPLEFYMYFGGATPPIMDINTFSFYSKSPQCHNVQSFFYLCAATFIIYEPKPGEKINAVFSYGVVDDTAIRDIPKKHDFLTHFSPKYGSINLIIQEVKCSDACFVRANVFENFASLTVVYSWVVYEEDGAGYIVGRDRGDAYENPGFVQFPFESSSFGGTGQSIISMSIQIGVKLFLSENFELYAFGSNKRYGIPSYNSSLPYDIVFSTPYRILSSYKVTSISEKVYGEKATQFLSSDGLKESYYIVFHELKCGNEYPDSKNVCNGKGTCIGLELCACDYGWKGIYCGLQRNAFEMLIEDYWYVLLIVTFLLIIILLVSLVFCICSITVISQKKKLKKYNELEDFDLLLSEQKASKSNTSTAHLKINKALFEVNYNDIKVERKIGQGGSSSIVFKARWKGKICAFKCFKTEDICREQNSFDEFERELSIISSVSHPNILQFFGATLKVPRVGILMEFCDYGDMKAFFKLYHSDNGEYYPSVEKMRMLMEITSAMVFLHSKKIIHRDLKLENVLVTRNCETKVMDFGLSRMIENTQATKTTRIGTCIYMAPEITLGGKYNEKCDVFSFGIMIFSILTNNNFPYGTTSSSFKVEYKVSSDPTFRPKIKKGDFDDCKWIVPLMQRCWAHEPDKRPSFQTILNSLEKENVVMSDSLRGNLILKIQRNVQENKEYEMKIAEIKEKLKKVEEKNNKLKSELREAEENLEKLTKKNEGVIFNSMLKKLT